MKTTARLIFIALMALPTALKAQEPDIQHVFDKIINTKGVTHSDTRYVERDEDGTSADGRIIESTVIYEIGVGRYNFGLFNELEEAFQNGYFPTTPTTVYTCFNPMEGSARQQWSILTKRDDYIRIGQHTGSSYAIVVMPDEDNPKFRTVYAAEWWDTDDPNIRQGRLVRSYGEKPAMQGYTARAEWKDIQPWIKGSAKIVDVEKYMNMADSLLKIKVPAFSADSLMMLNILSHRTDATKNPQEWMRQAIINATNLDGTDWMRLFGMLTQKMLDRADKESPEDLIVAAGIILDLCKNAEDVEKDEKEICVARLRDVAKQLQSRSQYVYDLLMLGAKKLVKNN
ncbi:MAG: hypothetical protein J5797_12690 [Prevotella sp.]|nr:hypothetical protein [Prevotella sp.]